MGKRQFLSFIIITWMVVAVLYGQLSDGQSPGRNNRRRRPVNGRRRAQGMNPDIHRAYLQALNQPITTPSTTPSLLVYGRIPRLPEPHETECHIDIRVSQRKRGFCIQAGGVRTRPYMCQSGMFLREDPTCQQVMENRNNPQQTTQQPLVDG